MILEKEKNYIYDLNINLPIFINLDNNEIIKIYGEDKSINYGEIYSFLLSKNNQVRNWSAKITEIDDTNKRNEAKTNFRNCI